MHSIPIDHVRGATRSIGGGGSQQASTASTNTRTNHMSGEQ